MKLMRLITIIALSGTPAFSLDLSGTSYVGLTQSDLKSTFKCSPSFLILGGGRRLVCRDDLGVRFTFIVKGTESVAATVIPTRPALSIAEATTLLQSHCTPNESTKSLMCGDMIQGSVEESGGDVAIEFCKAEHCEP